MIARCTAPGRTGAPCRAPHWRGSYCVGHASQGLGGAELAAAAQAEQARRANAHDLTTYRDRPVDFARDVLEVNPWERQAELLQAVADHDRVAVRSGHKTGKSTSVAIASLWFAATRPGARVVLTAPTYRQVRHVLWREVKRLARRLPSSLLDEEAINDVPEVGIALENGAEVLGFTADNAEKFAGISGADLLFVVDEASGVDAEIYEAIEGSSAGDAKVLLAGNPTRPSGQLYDAFHDRKDVWHGIHISSRETPNVIEGRIVVPGLATRRWVEERDADWGKGSPHVAVRVDGEWPAQSSNAVIGMALVDEAVARYRREAFAESTAPLVLGVDPARFGEDESVVVAVRGNAMLPPYVFRGLDSIQLAAEVHRIAVELVRAHGIEGNKAIPVNVDETGVGGGVVDQLRTYRDLAVHPVNAGESPGNPRYQRRRDELWFGILDWIKGGGCLAPDRKLTGELTAVEYSFAPTGKIVVESKDTLRPRLGRSPDRADALALAVHESGDRFAGLLTQAMRAVRGNREAPGPLERRLVRGLKGIAR